MNGAPGREAKPDAAFRATNVPLRIEFGTPPSPHGNAIVSCKWGSRRMQDDFDFATHLAAGTSVVNPLGARDEAGQAWNAPISVSQLNLMARQMVERAIPLLWVAGEISNFTRATSGHCYFSLKDERAQVRCVMFRHRMQHLDWAPVSGMQVEVRGAPTIYESRGEFQLTVDFMRRAGLGALYEAFARLKAQLETEGLFDAARKRPVPVFPRRIGLITSRAAAALRDVLATLRRRMASVPVILYPTPVQGEGAGPRIASAIDAASRRGECDVLILCRGGGSIEDLWAFNEEVVARALARCSIPVVCGVGHETDFTIADFAADARAPTPTAAAELVSPSAAALRDRLAVLHARIARAVWRLVERRMQQTDYFARRLVHPGERVRDQRRHLAHLAVRLARAAAQGTQQIGLQLETLRHRLGGGVPELTALEGRRRALARRFAAAGVRGLELRASALARLGAQLGALSPQLVLERGYSIVATAEGKVVRDARQVGAGDRVTLTFSRGVALARVERTRS